VAKSPSLIERALMNAEDILTGYIKPTAETAARSAEATIQEALRRIEDARLAIQTFQQKRPTRGKRKAAGRKGAAKRKSAAKKRSSGGKRKSAAKRGGRKARG
jgi:hypothetical protein